MEELVRKPVPPTVPRPKPIYKANPFTTNEIMPKNEMFEAIMPTETKQEIKEEPVNQFAQSFLGELREFMDEFAETDLNIDSIEEPAEMNKSQANFYIKLYNKLLTEESDINELCDGEIERVTRSVNLFRQQRLDEISKKKSYFESILKDFAMTELEGKKTKTIKLPYGNLSFKKQQPKYNYGDESELISMVKQLKPELVTVETKEKLDKSALKKNGKIENGQFYLGDVVIPTVTVQLQEDKFEIK